MAITETILEMHFHHSLMELFRTTFGVGKDEIQFFKFSPQKECFVGFDQAYVKTELSHDDFFNSLGGKALQNGYKLASNDLVFGYFLQFKVVKEMKVLNRNTPNPPITSSPYLRVSLDTIQNRNTGIAQHEMLYNLSRNKNAFVYYACPMIFQKEELYELPDLDKLKLADFSSCPSSFLDNKNHHIYFQDPSSVPFWCSKPTEGTWITPNEMVFKIKERVSRQSSNELRLSLLDLLEDIDYLNVKDSKNEFWIDAQFTDRENILKLVSDSLVIIKINRK